MNKLPNMVEDLLEKFGRCEIVRQEYDMPLDQFKMNVKMFYGACVIVRNKEGQFVLVRHRFNLLHAQGPNLWALPCGKLKRNESLEEAGARETLEETGLRIKITGLYRIFQFIQKALGGESRTESYVAVFFGEAVSGGQSIKSPEILEVKKLKNYPKILLVNYRSAMKA